MKQAIVVLLILAFIFLIVQVRCEDIEIETLDGNGNPKDTMKVSSQQVKPVDCNCVRSRGVNPRHNSIHTFFSDFLNQPWKSFFNDEFFRDPFSGPTQLTRPYVNTHTRYESSNGVLPKGAFDSVDIAEFQNYYLVKMDVPGVPKHELHMKAVTDKMGKISIVVGGKRPVPNYLLKNDKEVTKEKENPFTGHIRQKRFHGSFETTLSFINSIDVNGIESDLNLGVLTLKIPFQSKQQERVQQIPL